MSNHQQYETYLQHTLRKLTAGGPAPRPQPRPHNYDTVKIGRNTTCVCGSGKKFKHCCIGKFPNRVKVRT